MTTSAMPEHIALIVPDLDAAMSDFSLLGHRWAPITTPTATLRFADGRVESTVVRYVTSSGQLPHVKLIEEVPGTYWTRQPGSGVHHLTYWVDDIEAASAALTAQGARLDADGLDMGGELRYRYLALPSGTRIEFGLIANRPEFEQWADGAEFTAATSTDQCGDA